MAKNRQISLRNERDIGPRSKVFEAWKCGPAYNIKAKNGYSQMRPLKRDHWFDQEEETDNAIA
ncbi:hypothetical protein RND71_031078 [Anisodus tanguticus]|uniref:Uncharacterized protein n=1 Tax=Anisodus tanguticus TaxID=243964 RepID=A0AAE1UX77_9SOLA|nr:hypothetical protein RND71_031078 [Anisodus tanguticus]